MQSYWYTGNPHNGFFTYPHAPFLGCQGRGPGIVLCQTEKQAYIPVGLLLNMVIFKNKPGT